MREEPFWRPIKGNTKFVRICSEAYSSYCISPIVAGGDPIGAVILLSKDEAQKMGDLEVKLTETAAGFLAKQMEQ